METYSNNEGKVNDELNNEQKVDSAEQGAQEEQNPETEHKKNHHTSALYAASMWHSTIKHVKPPHSGEGLLPTQA